MPAITRRALLSTGPFILSAKAKQTNLLFLMSDQHQRAASGCYGHTEAKTPHIDEIARNGIRFNRTYCQAPVCVPSRGSLITGVYPHAHGARILQDPLSAEARTIAHFFGE
ncbi:MAG: sulfatase-like hydrolase/transferase, partial [bacterium]|nr:sulfatase-like hydrolase/transferase [bacterium]